MCFPYTDCPLRTDQTFRERHEPRHHREYSVLEELPIDMIKDFVTSDALHLLELGVMRRLLNIWKNGSTHFDEKWTKSDILKLNDLLERCNFDLPKEIHRRMRSIDRLNYWKGTEYRTMLLYIGIVLLKDLLSAEIYSHFLLLFSAVTICSTKAHRQFLMLAEVLFRDYIELTIEYYGTENVVSNIHNLCHIVDDVRRFGDLTTLTTYPFENMLRLIKLKLKSCNKVLQQASRRITESAASMLDEHEADCVNPLKYPYRLSSEDHIIYKQLFVRDGFTLSARNHGDMWFMLNTGDNVICKFEYAHYIDGEIKIIGSALHSLNDFFEKPFRSSLILIFRSDGTMNQNEKICCTISDLKCKLVCLKHKNEIVLLPLLHTFSDS